jgi:16S rRNA (cytosine1402-N4)-methyltransferase
VVNHLNPTSQNASSSPSSSHISVLLNEVLQALAPQPGEIFVDATLGAGGHAEALLARLQPGGLLFGIDQDPSALRLAGERLGGFGNSFHPLQGNFSQLGDLLPQNILPITGGVLADIGVSSMQLDQGERGFSFMKEAPLDMRMSPDNPLTAAEVVNTYSETRLVQLFSEYGEEHMSKTLARRIVEERAKQSFKTTLQLAGLISAEYKSHGKHEKIHPATRVFQALRIEVNDELGHLQRFLESLPALLAPGARVAVISFHSLEDRIVKQFFQAESRDCICPPRLPVCKCGHQATFKVMKGKPLQATEAEIKLNPRSRSAKLRAAVRL